MFHFHNAPRLVDESNFIYGSRLLAHFPQSTQVNDEGLVRVCRHADKRSQRVAEYCARNFCPASLIDFQIV